jgi:calcineurin-like phosphoesterase family protein
MNIWFSADWHLSHFNVIKYSKRPFSSTEEMDEAILENFFSLVKRGDIFYFLGDLTFNKEVARNVLQKIKHEKIHLHMIFGNHDYKNIKTIIQEMSDWCGDLKSMKVNDQSIVLSHYAMRVWDKSHYGSWNAFGHSHGNLKGEGKQFDVGVDTNEFKPYSFDDMKKIMDTLPENFNFIPEENRGPKV